MTHPLTPREKVPSMSTVDLTDDMLFEVSPGEVVTWAEIKRRAALASSGDHAELARLADDLRKFEHHAVGSLKIDMGEVRRVIAACDAHTALIAEVAALRAKVERLEREADETALVAYQATEAERKLDEAVGLLRRIDRTYADMQDGNGNHPTELRKVRAFLSKEAERG